MRIEPRPHGLVPDVVVREQRAIALDALPEPLEPLGLVGLEPAHRVHDRARQAKDVHLALGEAALLAELTHQLAPIELLDGVHEAGGVDPLDVDDLGLHAPLDRRRQRVDGAHGIGRVGAEVRRDRNGRTERDEHAALERLARLERQPDRDQRELARPRVAERDARRARPDALHARLGVRGALGIDGHDLVVGEGAMAGREHGAVGVFVHGLAPHGILASIHRDGAGGEEEAGQQPLAEERRGREIVDLARHHRTDQERVDQVVRMVDAEEHGPGRRHTLGVAYVDAPEEEPHPEAREATQRRVEAIGGGGGRRRGADGHGGGPLVCSFRSVSKSSSGSVSAHSAPSDSFPYASAM